MAARAGDYGKAAKAGPENVFDSVLRYGIKAIVGHNHFGTLRLILRVNSAN